MPAPQQMEREGVGMQTVAVAPSAAPLLEGVTSIKFGPAGMDPHTFFQGQGSGPFGMAPRGLRGETPVTDQDGKVLATLKFSTNNSQMGQLSAQLLLPDGTLFVQFERSNRTKTMAMSEDATTVSVNGVNYASVSYGGSGSLLDADGRNWRHHFCIPHRLPGSIHQVVHRRIPLFLPHRGHWELLRDAQD